MVQKSRKAVGQNRPKTPDSLSGREELLLNIGSPFTKSVIINFNLSINNCVYYAGRVVAVVGVEFGSAIVLGT